MQAPTLCTHRPVCLRLCAPGAQSCTLPIELPSKAVKCSQDCTSPSALCYLFWCFLPHPGESRQALQMDSYALLALSFLGIYGFLSLCAHTLGSNVPSCTLGREGLRTPLIFNTK